MLLGQSIRVWVTLQPWRPVLPLRRHSHFRWKTARCERARRDPDRGRRILRNDRGYLDFERLYRFTLSSAFFVTRAKENVLLQRRYSHVVDQNTGVRSDHTVVLTTVGSATVYPDPLRRVS
jgi:hypothetical protein